MTANQPAKKRKRSEPIYPKPDPKPKLPEPGAGCSTPELTSGLTRGVKEALRKLNPSRKDDGGTP